MLKGKIIGGDFELESIPSGLSEQDVFQTYGVSGTWTTSGRAALAVILQHLINNGVDHGNIFGSDVRASIFRSQRGNHHFRCANW